jgi:hypothetical protein
MIDAKKIRNFLQLPERRMDSTKPNPVSDSDDLKLPRHQSANRAERERIRAENRKRKAQGIGIAFFLLTTLAGSFILLAKGCPNDASPTSASTAGF